MSLLIFLGYLRGSVVRKVEDLTEDDARRQLVSSKTNLLGLVQHLTFAESYWFDHVFRGTDDPLSGRSMTVAEDRSVAEVIDDYRLQTDRSDLACQGMALDTRSAREDSTGETVTLRWILLHMIEETARHAGHADILREMIDGRTGR